MRARMQADHSKLIQSKFAHPQFDVPIVLPVSNAICAVSHSALGLHEVFTRRTAHARSPQCRKNI